MLLRLILILILLVGDILITELCLLPGVGSSESTETLTALDDTLLETTEKTQELRNRLFNWF